MTYQVEQSTIKLLFPTLTPFPNKTSCFVVSYRNALSLKKEGWKKTIHPHL